MTTLPETPFTLNGGCFCTAIRYTISIPSLANRPLLPTTPNHPIGPQNTSTSRLPRIFLDHCNSCRRVAGSIIQLWLILPQPWVQFSLLLKDQDESQPQSQLPWTDSSKSTHISPPTSDILAPSNTEITQSTYLTKFASSKGVSRTFCSRCGTHLTFVEEKKTGMTKVAEERGLGWEAMMDVTVGSLDKEGVEMEGLRPREVGFEEDGIAWLKEWLREGESLSV